MPIYEYRCSQCLHHFEVRQGFDDEPLTLCPVCRGQARRIIHPAPVIFKGPGFYVTDNRKPNLTSEEPKEKPKEKEAASPTSEAPKEKPKEKEEAKEK